MEIDKPHALLVQPVTVGRVDHLIAQAAQVAVSLVIGHDQDDVGPAARLLGGRATPRAGGQRRGDCFCRTPASRAAANASTSKLSRRS